MTFPDRTYNIDTSLLGPLRRINGTSDEKTISRRSGDLGRDDDGAREAALTCQEQTRVS